MTEAEIMKALECYRNSKIIPTEEGCISIGDIIDLINRKNAEIEDLQHEKTELQHKIEKLNLENLQMVASIKGLEARAIKEFAERLLKDYAIIIYDGDCVVYDGDIYNLAKEMGVE
jgi:peptide deformylase